MHMNYRSLVSSGQRSLEIQHASSSNYSKAVYIQDLKHTICSAVDVVHCMVSSIFSLISRNYNELMRLILLPFLCEMDGQNSIIIIIVGGANMRGWTKKMSDDELEIVRNAGGVLLQREIPDSINIQVAKLKLVVDVLQDVKRAVVPVILDVEEMDTPIPNELLDSVDVLSSNETELSLLTGKHTETFEQFSQAVAIS
ncbi:hypothetical protein HID58_093370 [Brassica napus]|uniref:Uncharacterized protein n=1 Tax=Brassica napus TaxID=3708 RepID=A0ABQ7XBC0_BRANA|nr:hypothetical protein HID58_093370 [Brassica napus]